MEMYLLKSTACLAILYAFYKLVIERENMHTFKRFFLLGAVAISFGIPYITFTEYVEVTTTLAPVFETQFVSNTTAEVVETINYWNLILWAIYGIGVLFFATRFIYNIWDMVAKIRKNPNQQERSIVYVLLHLPTTPHTFFKYIFLNRRKFEAKEIPEEVLIHEEAHARQLHSLDVLIIELLQIVFWFNPFIYFLKHSIKLNHEFLADRAVLRQGSKTSDYQNILLAFSSNANAPQLANSINYSFINLNEIYCKISFGLIKKRFTVMKKQTSKTGIWLRSLLLVPLTSLLIYGFSTTKIIEKPSEEILTGIPLVSQSEVVNGVSIPVLEISEAPMRLKLNGQVTSLKMLTTDFRNLTGGQLSNLEIKAKGALKLSFIENVYTLLEGNLDKILLLDGAHVEHDTANISGDALYHEQDPVNDAYHKWKKETLNNFSKATPKQLEKYNRLAKKYNAVNISERKIPMSDLMVLESIYRKMTDVQKNEAQAFPECLPKNKRVIGTLDNEGNQIAANMQQKDFILMVQVSEITLNGKSSSLKTFAKDVDRLTKNWEETDYTSVKPNIFIASTPKEFLNKVDAEFRKTHYSKANGGMGIIPPPPPPPPAPPATTPPPAPPTAPKAIYDQTSKGVNHQGQAKSDGITYNGKLVQIQGHNDKLKTQGKVIQGQLVQLPPPPPSPPAPEEPLDHIISMAKKGATFYYEGKKVSSDRAIQIVKQNEHLNIDSRSRGSEGPVVRITKAGIKIKSGPGTSSRHSQSKNDNISVKTGNVTVNGQKLFYSTKDGITSYYNQNGQVVNSQGKAITRDQSKVKGFYYNGSQISSEKAENLLKTNNSIKMSYEQLANSYYNIVLTEMNMAQGYANVNHNVNSNPNSLIDLTEVISKGATFYFNDKPITTEKAKYFAEQTDEIARVSVKTPENGSPIVYFWSKS